MSNGHSGGTIDVTTLVNAGTPSGTVPFNANPYRLSLKDVGDECEVIFFTKKGCSLNTHLKQCAEGRIYVGCNGPDCILCKIPRVKSTLKGIIPAYDLESQEVVLLTCTLRDADDALLPQIVKDLEAAENGARCIHKITLGDYGSYTVKKRPITEGDDDGAEAIERFQQAMAEGKVDLKSAYDHKTNEELLEYQEVAKEAERLGLK